METQLVNRYASNMHGVLSCYDRILIAGTLPGAGYANHTGGDANVASTTVEDSLS